MGSGYIKTPKALDASKALLNIQNDDHMCALYCALAALHPVSRKDHPYRVSHYKRYQDDPRTKLNIDGINFPMQVRDFKKFENQNPSLGVNVFRLGKTKEDCLQVYIK